MTALTRAVSGEKQIYSGNLEILSGIGKPGKFLGNMRYFWDIEQRFDITCYQTIYMHSDMHPVYALYFVYFGT